MIEREQERDTYCMAYNKWRKGGNCTHRSLQATRRWGWTWRRRQLSCGLPGWTSDCSWAWMVPTIIETSQQQLRREYIQTITMNKSGWVGLAQEVEQLSCDRKVASPQFDVSLSKTLNPHCSWKAGCRLAWVTLPSVMSWRCLLC